MTRVLQVQDVVEGRPSASKMVLRALRLRCPRCASKGVTRRWFQLVERCPECGVLYKRDEAFFFGSFVLNLFITLTALFFVLTWLMFREAAQPGSSLVLPTAVGFVCAVGLPIFMYPFSMLAWSAFDLSSDPLDVDEITGALDAIGEPDETEAATAHGDDEP